MLIGLFASLKLIGIVGMIGIPVCLSILVNLEKEGTIHWMPSNNKKETSGTLYGEQPDDDVKKNPEEGSFFICFKPESKPFENKSLLFYTHIQDPDYIK